MSVKKQLASIKERLSSIEYQQSIQSQSTLMIGQSARLVEDRVGKLETGQAGIEREIEIYPENLVVDGERVPIERVVVAILKELDLVVLRRDDRDVLAPRKEEE